MGCTNNAFAISARNVAITKNVLKGSVQSINPQCPSFCDGQSQCFTEPN